MKYSVPRLALLASFALLSPMVANAAEPLFRSRLGDGTTGAVRTVGVKPPSGWRLVETINRDPLSLAQWVPKQPRCATGASTRISLYAVDVGSQGPNRLVQKWLPAANSFQVVAPESGFAIVRARSEASDGVAQTVIAYPYSEQFVTPLAGWVGGVNILFVAESTSTSLDELEENLRQTLRGRYAVAAKSVHTIDQPFVLFGKKWHKALQARWQEAEKKKQPLALVSQAYALFGEAGAYVPQGQNLLLKAAELGHDPSKMDLVRLARRSLMTVDVAPELLQAWESELAKKGSEDAKFWSAERVLMADEASKNQVTMRSLANCGQPEAKRFWTKKQVQSFNSRERYLGRLAVVNMMQEPPLEATLPITTRVPRAVEAPAIQQLKVAAVLKTACPNEDDPDETLFVKKADFKTAKTFKKNQELKAETLAPPEEAEFPELKEASRMDRLANAGDQGQLKEALKIACKWPGSESDRQNLITELAIRRDGLGKWKRFRSCSVLKEHQMSKVCRDRDLKQAKLNLDTRFNNILIAAGMSYDEAPDAVMAAIAFRKKAMEFADRLLDKSYAQAASVRETKELDEIRYALESEFMSLLAATLNKEDAMGLESQIGEVVTGRRLLMLPAEDGNMDFALKRQAPTEKFMKRELERLEARLKDTMKSIQEADKIDLSPAFKEGLAAAHQSWEEYRKAHARFVGRVAEAHPHVSRHGAAAQLWFHIEGIYYFEKLRDRQMSRVPDSGLRAVSSEETPDVDFGAEQESIFADELEQ